jgi:hypothetical protein
MVFSQTAPNGSFIDLVPVGQTRDFVFQVNSPPSMSTGINYFVECFNGCAPDGVIEFGNTVAPDIQVTPRVPEPGFFWPMLAALGLLIIQPVRTLTLPKE